MLKVLRGLWSQGRRHKKIGIVLKTDRILLSICIATYNRGDYISTTLNSILDQLVEGVEVIIVDGASTDNTQQIVEKYLEISNQLKYYRLTEKGGVDLDYCRAIEFASGEMCWLFTDDDILKPDAISIILGQLDYNHSVIIVNSEVLNANLMVKISDSLLATREDKLFTAGEVDLLFKYSISYLSFIGCVVINRKLWNERDKLSYIGTEFVHVGVIFQDFLPSTVKVIGEPLIQLRYGNSQWTSRAFSIGMIKWTNLIYSFNIISKANRDHFTFSSFRKWLRSMLLYRAKGVYGVKEYFRIVQSNIGVLRKFWALLILIVPCVLINFIVLSFIRTSKTKNAIVEYDLVNCRCNLIYSKSA